MRFVLLASLVATMAANLMAEPLTLSVAREGDSLKVKVMLNQSLPESFEDALPTGAVVDLSYVLIVRNDRRLWWDKKLWRGRVTVSAAFDPVIGRFRLESVLDDVIVASREVTSVDEARSWLVSPPEVRLALRESTPEWQNLLVRARAEFATDTVWLIFPTTDATDWAEEHLNDPTRPEGDR